MPKRRAGSATAPVKGRPPDAARLALPSPSLPGPYGRLCGAPQTLLGGSFGLPPRLPDEPQQPFFSAALQPVWSGSAGRSRQIRSLISVKPAIRVRHRWYSWTCSAARRKAEGVAKDSDTLLPFSLCSRRNWGCPSPSGLAQWQPGLPQRRGIADTVPGRKSPSVKNCCKKSVRWASSSARVGAISHLLY